MSEITQTNNDLKVTKEDAYKTLERTIAFNNNCDSKATTILTIYGVLITVSLSSDSVKTIKNIVKTACSNFIWYNVVYLLCFGVSVLAFIAGMFCIMSVLLSKTDCEEYSQDELNLNSIIYFGDIANSKKNPDYGQYKQKVMRTTEEDILNDIISQVYLNSKICKKKFTNYKYGFLISIIGLIASVILGIIGYLLY